MNRAGDALRTACGLALVAVWVLWWCPMIAARVGGLVAARVRFAAVIAWADVLRATRRTDAARRLYLAEVARCERRMRAVRGGRQPAARN